VERGGFFVSGIPTAAVGRAAVIAVVLSVLGVVLILVLVLQHVFGMLAGRIGRVLVVVVDGLAAAFFAASQSAAVKTRPGELRSFTIRNKVAASTAINTHESRSTKACAIITQSRASGPVRPVMAYTIARNAGYPGMRRSTGVIWPNTSMA